MPIQDDPTVDLQATYDRIADRYLANKVGQPEHLGTPFLELEGDLIDGLGEALLIADLGCGLGTEIGDLARRGARVVGLDLSEGMLRLATEAASALAVGDLRHLPVATDAFDGVWSSAALLHVPTEDTQAVFSEMRRILRRGGRLALVTALGDRSFLEPVPYAPGEQRRFVYRSIEAVFEGLAKAEFSVVAYREVEQSRHWLMLLAEAD